MLSRLPLISKLNVPTSCKCWGSCCSPAVGILLWVCGGRTVNAVTHTPAEGRRGGGPAHAGRAGFSVPGRKPPQGWEGPGQAVQEEPRPVGPGPRGPERERGRKAARVRPGWLGHQGLPPPGGSWSSQGSSPRLWLVSMAAVPSHSGGGARPTIELSLLPGTACPEGPHPEGQAGSRPRGLAFQGLTAQGLGQRAALLSLGAQTRRELWRARLGELRCPSRELPNQAGLSDVKVGGSWL